MSASDARAEVQRLIVELLSAGLAVDFNTTVVVQKGGHDSLVTWAAGRNETTRARDTEASSIAEYRRLLMDREFSCVLSDGSLLQLSFSYHRDELKKHRMVYYPCPVSFSPGEFVPEEVLLLDSFDLALADGLEGLQRLLDGGALIAQETLDAPDPLGEMTTIEEDELSDVLPNEPSERVRLRAPMRFDYDIDAMGPGHPGSHLHLSDNVRWAAFGPLSLGHFVRFVFRHFYPDGWDSNAFLREWPMNRLNRSVQGEETCELFIECLDKPAA